MKKLFFKREYRKSFYVGLIMVTIVLLLALIGTFWTPYDGNAVSALLKNKAPSLAHPFGTDNLGRDVLSRVMSGTSLSFLIAFTVTFIGAGIGTVVGSITGYFGGAVDAVIMRINDCLAAFPNVLLALVVIAVVGNGKYNLILALGIVFIPSFVRIARGEMLKQKELDYVKNLRLMGAGDLQIIFLDILPNMKTALFSAILIGFQNAVLSEAGMSYLGLGVTPPDASLGRMLYEAQSYLVFAPWSALAPGMAVLFFTLGLGLISHGITER